MDITTTVQLVTVVGSGLVKVDLDAATIAGYSELHKGL